MNDQELYYSYPVVFKGATREVQAGMTADDLDMAINQGMLFGLPVSKLCLSRQTNEEETEGRELWYYPHNKSIKIKEYTTDADDSEG